LFLNTLQGEHDKQGHKGHNKRQGSQHFESDHHRDADHGLKDLAGVVEGRPGIIESSHIPPLDDQKYVLSFPAILEGW
jgi:hypothetical protein